MAKLNKDKTTKKKKKRKYRKGCSIIESKRRTQIIYELLLNGCTRSEVIQNITDEHPDIKVSIRQIDNYIKRAKEELYSDYEENKKKWLNKSKKRLNALYRKNMDNKDLKECRSIIETENKVFGYEKSTLEVSGIDGAPIKSKVDYSDMTEEDAEKAVREALNDLKDKEKK